MQEEKPNLKLVVNQVVKININITTEVRQSADWKPVESNIDLKNNPELCNLVFAIISMTPEETASLKIPEKYLDFLLQSGLLVPVPEKPDGKNYRCLISVPPNPLNSTPVLGQIRYSELKVNQFIYLQETLELPEMLKESLPFNNFTGGQYPLVWVKSAKTGLNFPFWPTPENQDLINGLIKGEKSINALPEPLIQQLLLAEILIPNNLQSFTEQTDSAKQSLAANGYVVLRNIINPLQTGALRTYYRELTNKDYFIRDAQVPKRDIIRNEPVAKFIHYQLTNLLNRITPEKVKPSYSYLSMYKPGAVLKKHTDREQCAWNMSLVIDTDPDYIWPIYLETGGLISAVKLEIGDAVIYRGTKIPHWREQLPDNQQATICFYHFVAEDFAGPLYNL